MKDDVISRQAAIDAVNSLSYPSSLVDVKRKLIDLSSAQPESRREWYMKGYREAQDAAQPETAKRIVTKSRNGMTLWYQCDMCHEPVDAQDNYCRGCGRRLIDE